MAFIIIIILIGVVTYLIQDASLKSQRINSQKLTTKRKLPPEEVDRLRAIIDRKRSVEEIVEEANSNDRVFLWCSIDHLTEDELIEVATMLNKTKLRRWFNNHKKDYFYFPPKAYAFIQSKLNNEKWLTDEEYESTHSLQ